MPAPPPPERLLARPPAWRPPPQETDAWAGAILGDPAAGEPLHREARWWLAHRAALAGAWAEVGALAEAGLAEPFSEREAVRLALLHVLSGSLSEAEHVVAQAVQLHGDESLPARFAALCAEEGLADGAARFR